MEKLNEIISRFPEVGAVDSVRPLGSGLINDTYVVRTASADAPDYVMQRINHAIFKDVDLLQKNIEAVTSLIRDRLEAEGDTDIDRHVLRFIKADTGKTYFFDGESYWRLMVYIPRSVSYETVDAHYAELAGREFGRFEARLTSLADQLGETIPDFHNMTLRLRQLEEAVEADPAGRVAEVMPIVEDIRRRAYDMTFADRLYAAGLLPKRVCHCDTKVNNMLFDAGNESFLCVIDLDTVMPGYVFSDVGDFMRTAGNTMPEDSPEYDRIDFRADIFEAFMRGYLSTATEFLTAVEIEHLPDAAAMFPYMQAVRFLTDYINGDHYYKVSYPGHNLVRTRNQMRLLECVEARLADMRDAVAGILKARNQ